MEFCLLANMTFKAVPFVICCVLALPRWLTDRATVLQGLCPKHKGLKDPALLLDVDQLMAEVMAVPAVRSRLEAAVAINSFEESVDHVSTPPNPLHYICIEGEKPNESFTLLC